MHRFGDTFGEVVDDGLGLRFARLRDRVKRLYSQMPVVFVTGVAYPDIIAQASPDGVLEKPFRIAQIEELIESTLEAGRFSSSSL